jgi:hypothetical protein
VTLPNIKWGLLYGVLLCNARAMGEFGAVSVVSGHIRGETNTMPLHVEILYNEYNFAGGLRRRIAAGLLALVTLVFKTFLEARTAMSSPATRPLRPSREPWKSASNVRKEFDRFPALNGVARHPLGRTDRAARPFGLGKTTLLRSSPGSNADRRARSLRRRGRLRKTVQERNVGFVFQHYALFKHMTVLDNVGFGLRCGRAARPPRPRSPRGPRTARSGAALRPREALSRTSSRAGSGSAWRWRAPWPSSRACCCSTSRSARSTRRCARNCALAARNPRRAPATPRCS